MPLHTPSPHRFLAPAPPTASKPKPKPQSGLRHVASASTPRPTAIASRESFDDVPEPRRVTPAKRFVVPSPSSRKTPNVGERRRAQEQVDDTFTPLQSTPRPKPRFNKVESIEIASPSSSANAETQDGFDIMPSIEQSIVFDEDEERADEQDDADEEILFVIEERNKRRRISPELPTSPSHVHSDPSTPHPNSSPQIASPVTHRFKVPAPPPSDSKHTSTPAGTSRPHFILPRLPPSPSKAAVPLPETFSPSRKIGKYIPNGMAATLQSWIHEAASTGYSATTGAAVVWGREKEDGVKMRVHVASVTPGRMGRGRSDDRGVECLPGSVVLVRGTIDTTPYDASTATDAMQVDEEPGSGAKVRIMLAGQGGTRGRSAVWMKSGGVVGVRAPIWDVCLGTGEEAEKWLVAVEWVIL